MQEQESAAAETSVIDESGREDGCRPEARTHLDQAARIYAETLRTPQQLARAGLVRHDLVEPLQRVADRYTVAVTPLMSQQINAHDSDDPIARMYVPSVEELETAPGELDDPIGDDEHGKVPGIVHRHRDRCLLLPTKLCPVYCRFCFRRADVGKADMGMLSEAQLEGAFNYIEAHPEIWEVIVTGGDPFILSPRRIAEIAHRMDRIAHVKAIRWHTRVPIVAPQLVSAELVAAVRGAGGKATIVGVHANHPNELTAQGREACRRLAQAGFMLVSQTVLLKGINDNAETLARLMIAFVECGVKPYYLHHPDMAPGTRRFRLSIAEGQKIVRQLRNRVSGLCQPHYVFDHPGGHGKAPLGPDYVTDVEYDDHDRPVVWLIEDQNNVERPYTVNGPASDRVFKC